MWKGRLKSACFFAFGFINRSTLFKRVKSEKYKNYNYI